MTDEGKKNPESPQQGGPRKPYTTPGLASEPIFETFALACGKLPGQGGSCNLSPMRS